MRLWHFDRSGSRGSQYFDINEKGYEFLEALLAFFYLMTEEQLGFDPSIKTVNGQPYIEITQSSRTERLILEELLQNRVAIVDRGTKCWKAYCDTDYSRKRPFLVKDSWQHEDRIEEGLLMKKAKELGVTGIAQYYYHETVRVGLNIDDTLTAIRRGKMKQGRQSFKGGKLSSESASASNRDPSTRNSGLTSASEPMRDPLPTRVHRRLVTSGGGKNVYKATSLAGIVNGFLGAIEGKHQSFRIPLAIFD